jgi:DNA-directed RNA polymerase subunit RPC12/RpoP
MQREVIECLQCHKKLRVPSDRGEIQVTCPHCTLRWFWTPPVRQEEAEHDESKEGASSRLAGLFGKAVSRVRGTSAVLSIEHCDGKFEPGGHIDVTVLVNVGAHETTMKELFVEIEAREVMNIPWSAIRSKASTPANVLAREFAAGSTPSFPWPAGEMTYEYTTFSSKLVLSQGKVMASHAEEAFTASMPWPKDIHPSYKGERIEHLWTLRAVMSLTGTNPKTQWFRIHIGT